MKKPLFTGVCTALVTPFRAGRVDEAALRRLVQRQIAAGVPALCACGTTGEASTLGDAEWEQTLRCVMEAAEGRAVIVAGTGANDLRHTLERAKRAAVLGAQAQLVVTPYYNKTTQNGLIAYYTRLASYVALPMILYNVPGRTGLNMLPDTAAQLASHPGVIGLKEASGNLNQMAELLRHCELPIYCGSDEINAPALRLGAVGVISVVSNLFPEKMIRLCAAASGEADRIQQSLQPLIRALFSETSPAPVKAALSLMGLCSPDVRLPLVQVQPETLERLRSLLPQEAMA